MEFQSRISPVFDFHDMQDTFLGKAIIEFQSRISPVFDFHTYQTITNENIQ